jgi:hypothetical protein
MTYDAELAARYRAGDFDNIPESTIEMDLNKPELEWFDDELIVEYGCEGYFPSANQYEFEELWFAILDRYPEYDNWSVEHGGLRFEKMGGPSYPKARYEEIIAEAFEKYVAIQAYIANGEV